MIDLSKYTSMKMHHNRMKFFEVNEEAINFIYQMVIEEGYSWGYVTQVYFYGSTPKLNKLTKTNTMLKSIKNMYMKRVQSKNRTFS